MVIRAKTSEDDVVSQARVSSAMEPNAEQERCTTNEARYAPCPFQVTRILAADERQQRRDNAKHEGLWQESPFKPLGAFKTRRSMNVLYFIEPYKSWLEMTCYKSFVREHTPKYTVKMPQTLELIVNSQ